MATKEQAIEWLMAHDWQGKESLCNCINNKYNGNVSKFLENEFNVVEDGTLHLKWGEDRGDKVSYTL